MEEIISEAFKKGKSNYYLFSLDSIYFSYSPITQFFIIL